MKKTKIGVCPQHTVNISQNMKAKRKQYGLKPHVTATVHTCMGDTLDKVAIELSEDDSEYKLWEKGQAVVVLSRTNIGKNTILVGNKKKTIQALIDVIKIKDQWMDYMDRIFDVVSINGVDGHECDRDKFFMNQDDFPYRIADLQIPTDKSGYSYFLVSTKDNKRIYIGETVNLGKRLDDHNKGYGAIWTHDPQYRPYALFAYVCGFDANEELRKDFEKAWELRRTIAQNNGADDIMVLAKCALEVISSYMTQGKTKPNQLRFILNVRETE